MAKDWNLVKRIVNILVTNAQHQNKMIKIIKKENKQTGEIEKKKEEITA